MDEKIAATKFLPLPAGEHLELAWCPPGTFHMGSELDGKHVSSIEAPKHRRAIKRGFWIGLHTVTRNQWRAVMGDEPLPLDRGEIADRLPVVGVSWLHALEFVERINRYNPGLRAHLPSEAQWEYACRGGTETSWFFGDEMQNLERYAWTRETSADDIKPVGLLKPNPWGLFDVYGNVSEWCADDFEKYGRIDDDTSAVVEGSTSKIARGGSFDQPAWACRSSSREIIAQENPFNESVGLRVAVDASK